MNQYVENRLREFQYADLLRPAGQAGYLRRRPPEPADAERIRYHEAAHLVAFLVYGVRCDEICAGAGRDGGFGAVDFPQSAPPNAVLVAVTAGPLAARRVGAKDAPSNADERMIRQALDQLGLIDCPRLRREREAAAERFLNREWHAIRAVAAELRRHSWLLYGELRRLMLGHWALRKFAYLYPVDQPRSRGMFQLK